MNEGEGKEEKSVKFLRNHFFVLKENSFLRQPGSGEGEGVRQKEKLTHSASQFNFVVLPPQG